MNILIVILVLGELELVLKYLLHHKASDAENKKRASLFVSTFFSIVVGVTKVYHENVQYLRSLFSSQPYLNAQLLLNRSFWRALRNSKRRLPATSNRSIFKISAYHQFNFIININIVYRERALYDSIDTLFDLAQCHWLEVKFSENANSCHLHSLSITRDTSW